MDEAEYYGLPLDREGLCRLCAEFILKGDVIFWFRGRQLPLTSLILDIDTSSTIAVKDVTIV